MNIAEIVCLKAINKKKKFSTIHAKIINLLIERNEMFADEIAEQLNIPEKHAEAMLEELVEKHIASKKLLKYSVPEPFEALNKIL
ncbi:MAG: hypothetical protein Q7S21_01350 [archaeon]|nr:hypothetical protein [archaeon]